MPIPCLTVVPLQPIFYQTVATNVVLKTEETAPTNLTFPASEFSEDRNLKKGTSQSQLAGPDKANNRYYPLAKLMSKPNGEYCVSQVVL